MPAFKIKSSSYKSHIYHARFVNMIHMTSIIIIISWWRTWIYS